MESALNDFFQINSASPARSTIPKKTGSATSGGKNSVIQPTIPRRSGTFSPGDSRVQTPTESKPSRTTNGQDIRQYVPLTLLFWLKQYCFYLQLLSFSEWNYVFTKQTRKVTDFSRFQSICRQQLNDSNHGTCLLICVERIFGIG